MSAKNGIGDKIEAEKFEPETTIKKKIDEIKYDHIKIIDSLYIKISSIKSCNISSSSEYLS